MYYKYRLQKKQVSTDNGQTWTDVSPLETRKGDVIGTYGTYSECMSGTPSPLTLEIVSAGTIVWGGSTIQYSIDNGQNWTQTSSSTINVNAGDKILVKGNNSQYSGNFIDTTSTAYYAVYGNIMSLISADNFENLTTFTSNNVFHMLFFNTHITDASDLVMPATALTEWCYDQMFAGCSSLTSAPELPATTLAERCYQQMFRDCTSLTSAPELPATTLAEGCYSNMFWGCTSLETAPSILPATTLTPYCYQGMFMSCAALTKAPELPATTLTVECYDGMFLGCRSLYYIKCLATDISASNCTNVWVLNTYSSGTFVKAASMTRWTTGTSGIPTGWTVQNT